MVEVKYEKVGYCRYKHMECCTGIALNTMVGFILAMCAFEPELNGTIWRWVMVLYGVGSVVYAGYALPKYLLSLKWTIDRPERELVELELINPGTVSINGYCWDVSYWNKKEVVVDCKDGIAYLPYRSQMKGVI